MAHGAVHFPLLQLCAGWQSPKLVQLPPAAPPALAGKQAQPLALKLPPDTLVTHEWSVSAQRSQLEQSTKHKPWPALQNDPGSQSASLSQLRVQYPDAGH